MISDHLGNCGSIPQPQRVEIGAFNRGTDVSVIGLAAERFNGTIASNPRRQLDADWRLLA